MKNLIFGSFLFSLLTVGIVSCEKEISENKTKAITEEKQTDLNSGTLKNSETYKTAASKILKDLNEYLNLCEKKSGYTFFSFWSNNPQSSLIDLENAGFISKLKLEGLLDILKIRATDLNDEQIFWNLILENMDSRFYDNGSGTPEPSQIIIFRCRGCLDGVPNNACYTSLWWTWGPGCEVNS